MTDSDKAGILGIVTLAALFLTFDIDESKRTIVGNDGKHYDTPYSCRGGYLYIEDALQTIGTDGGVIRCTIEIIEKGDSDGSEQ